MCQTLKFNHLLIRIQKFYLSLNGQGTILGLLLEEFINDSFQKNY